MIKSQFKGAQIFPKNATYPEGELKGEFGREFLEEYNGRVEKDYGNADVLKVLKMSRDGVVIGSNDYAVVLANLILPVGLRTATQADLERAMQSGISFAGTYTDTGLALRSQNGCNEDYARDILKQLKARNPRIKLPVMINLSDLVLEKSDTLPNGLRFKLTEGANPIYASILSSDGGNFSSEDVDLRTGLPRELGNGNRALYTRKDGLARVYLGWLAGLYSLNASLADSLEYGRVRVASADEGSAKPAKFLECVANLDKAKAEEIAKIEKRYAQALDILRGK